MLETNIEMYVIRGFPSPSTLPVDLKMCYGDQTHAYERVVDTFPGTSEGRDAAQKALGLMTLQLALSRWPERLRKIAETSNHLSAEESASLEQHAERIEATLRDNEWVFDVNKVEIARKRLSVTQGSVEVSYGGKLINCYGDDIKMIFRDKEAMEKLLYGNGRLIEREDDLDGCQMISNWAGLPNKCWHDAAKRDVQLSDPSELYSLYQDTQHILESVRLPYLSGKMDDSDLLARSIIDGYLYMPGFTASRSNLDLVISQLHAKYPYHSHRVEEVLPVLEAAYDAKAWHPEKTRTGCEIERGSCSENGFCRVHPKADGWEEFPTGQEPYTMVRANIAKMQVATYSEGDYSLVTAPDVEHFRAEILAATKFYAGGGRFKTAESFLGEVDPELLDFFPGIEMTVREIVPSNVSAEKG